MKQFNGYKKCSRCECIYPIMIFTKDKSTSDGLDCKCRECRKDYDAKQKKIYYKNNRERILKYKSKYYMENKERITEYNNEEKNKKKRGKYYKKYSNTKRGRRSIRKRNAKRRRDLNYVELINNPFPNEIDIEWHHINDVLVVSIPKITHKLYLGNKHRKKCNKLIEKLYMINLDTLLYDKHGPMNVRNENYDGKYPHCGEDVVIWELNK